MTSRVRGKDIEWDEQWLTDHYYEYPTVTECAKAYNETFGTNIGRVVFSHKCIKLNLTRGYTDEQKKWIAENYPHMGLEECTKAFNETFNQHRSIGAMRGITKKQGLYVTHERRQIASRTKDAMPIGGYMRHKGYLYVKVADALGERDNWVMLHRKVWEDAYGRIPDDYTVAFLDGNKENCSLDNLMAIPRSMHGVMCGYQLWSADPTLTTANIEWCKLRQALIDNGIDVRMMLKGD